ncbi:hypothetical protein [Myxacorys almedinensis]|uniref:Uncharacterized protein n=1 Tax=Myxacorys almedinensis A TaxID=2690445 RepID=A0A8J8CHX1_9CYAN|nr:hypothetical protein [Myxacorys almedinensis]NDJ17148.1 hypothetical protein [Myxacorys almedinensis A]
MVNSSMVNIDEEATIAQNIGVRIKTTRKTHVTRKQGYDSHHPTTPRE